jgi:hypothetical protein
MSHRNEGIELVTFAEVDPDLLDWTVSPPVANSIQLAGIGGVVRGQDSSIASVRDIASPAVELGDPSWAPATWLCCRYLSKISHNLAK